MADSSGLSNQYDTMRFAFIAKVLLTFGIHYFMELLPDHLTHRKLLADVQDIVNININTVLWNDGEKSRLRNAGK